MTEEDDGNVILEEKTIGPGLVHGRTNRKGHPTATGMDKLTHQGPVA